MSFDHEAWDAGEQLVLGEVEAAVERLYTDGPNDDSRKLDVIIVLLHKLLSEGIPHNG